MPKQIGVEQELGLIDPGLIQLPTERSVGNLADESGGNDRARDVRSTRCPQHRHAVVILPC